MVVDDSAVIRHDARAELHDCHAHVAKVMASKGARAQPKMAKPSGMQTISAEKPVKIQVRERTVMGQP